MTQIPPTATVALQWPCNACNETGRKDKKRPQDVEDEGPRERIEKVCENCGGSGIERATVGLAELAQLLESPPE